MYVSEYKCICLFRYLCVCVSQSCPWRLPTDVRLIVSQRCNFALAPSPPQVQSWVGRGGTACSLTSNFGFGEREGRAQKKKRSKSARLGLVAQVVYLCFRSFEVRRCSRFGVLWIPRCSEWSPKCCIIMSFHRMAIVQAHTLPTEHESFCKFSTCSTMVHAYTKTIVHACTQAISYARHSFFSTVHAQKP